MVYNLADGYSTRHLYFRAYFYLPSATLLGSSHANEWQKFIAIFSSGGEARNAGQSAWVHFGAYPTQASPIVHSTDFGLTFTPDVAAPGTNVRTQYPGIVTPDVWHIIEIEVYAVDGVNDIMRVWLDKDARYDTPDFDHTGAYFSTDANVKFDKVEINWNWIGWNGDAWSGLERPYSQYFWDHFAASETGAIGDTVGLLDGPAPPTYYGRFGTLFPR